MKKRGWLKCRRASLPGIWGLSIVLVFASKPIHAQSNSEKEAVPKRQNIGGAEKERDPASLDRIKSVQPKVNLKRARLEIQPYLGLSLNDPFYNHYVGGAEVTAFIGNGFGFGGNGAIFLANPQTETQALIRRSQTAVVAVQTQPEYWLLAHAQFSPIYGKVALNNRRILHYDIYFQAGGGIVQTDTERVAGYLGLGQRWLLKSGTSLHLSIKDVFFQDLLSVDGVERSELQNYLMIQMGIGFFVPPSFRRRGPGGRS